MVGKFSVLPANKPTQWPTWHKSHQVLLTQKPPIAVIWCVCVCSLSLSISLSLPFVFLTLGLGCAEQQTTPFFFDAAGAFSLQPGLRQSQSTSQSTLAIYTLLEATTFSSWSFLSVGSWGCLPQDPNQGNSRSSSSEVSFLCIWGLGSRILAPSTCNPPTSKTLLSPLRRLASDGVRRSSGTASLQICWVQICREDWKCTLCRDGNRTWRGDREKSHLPVHL